MLEKIRQILSPEKLQKWIYWAMLLLGASSCVSEALAHNMIRLALLLGGIYVVLYPSILRDMCKYKMFVCTMAAFAAMFYVSAVYGGNFFVAVHHESISYNYQMLGAFLACLFIFHKKKLIGIIYSMFVSLFLVNAELLYQYVQFGGRPASTIGHHVAWTALLYVILVPSLFVYLLNEKNRKRKLCGWLLAIMSMEALFANGARGAWIAVFTVVSLLIVYYVRDWKKLLAAVGAAVIFVGGSIYTTPSLQARIATIGDSTEHSQAQRYLFWQSATQMFLDHPIMGVGAVNYTSLYQTKYISPLADEPNISHAHNNFFHFLAEEGIIGMSLYSIMIGYCLWWSWKRRKNMFGMMLFASTLALVIYSLTDYTWQMFTPMRIYWVLLGICIRGAELSEQEVMG